MRTEEAPDLNRKTRGWARAEDPGLKACKQGPIGPPQPVDGVRRMGGVHHADEQVILQVTANAGKVGQDADAELPQLIGRTDAGEHQQLWRVDGSAGENDLAPRTDQRLATAAADHHADGAALLDRDADRLHVGQDRKVRTQARRIQERACGADTSSISDCKIVGTGAFRRSPVEIMGAGMASRSRAIKKA